MSKFGAKLLGGDNEPMLLREDSTDIDPSGGGSLGYNSMLMRADGTVMSKDHIKELRQRQGFCLTCEGEPTKIFAIKKSKLNPLWNKKDPVNVIHISYDGTCLRCNPTMDPHRGSRGTVGSVNSMLPGSLHSLNQGGNSRRRSSFSASAESVDSLQSSTRSAHSPMNPSMARMSSVSSTQSSQNHRGSWSPSRQTQTLSIGAPSALKRSKSIERSYSSDDTDHNLSSGLAKLRPLRRSNSDESVNNQGTGGRPGSGRPSGPGRQLMRSNSDDSLMIDFGGQKRGGRRGSGGHRRSNSDESVNDFKKFLMKTSPPPEVQELERQSSDRTFRYVKQAAAAAAAAATAKHWKEQTAIKTKEAAQENGGRRAQMERKESVDQDGFLEPEPGETVSQPSVTHNLFNDSFAGFQDIKTVDSFLEKHNKKIRDKADQLGEESKRSTASKNVSLSAPKTDKNKNGTINPSKSDTTKEKKKTDIITIPGPPETPKRSSSINRGRATPEPLPPMRSNSTTQRSTTPESVTPAASRGRSISESLADKEFQGKLVVDIVAIQSDLRGLATTNNSRFDQLERQMAVIWSQQKILLQQNTVIIEMLQLQADNMKKQMEQQDVSVISSGLGMGTKENQRQTSSEDVTEKGNTNGMAVTDVTEARRSSTSSSRSISRRKMENAGENGRQLSSTHLLSRKSERDTSSGGSDENFSQQQTTALDEESETSKSRRKREKAEKKRSSSTPASERSALITSTSVMTTTQFNKITHAPDGRELNRDDSGNQISLGEKSYLSATSNDTQSVSSNYNEGKSLLYATTTNQSSDDLSVYKSEEVLSTSSHSHADGGDGGGGSATAGGASVCSDMLSPSGHSLSDDAMLSDLKRRKSVRKEKKKSSKKEKRKSFTNKEMAAAAAALMEESNEELREYEVPLSQY